MSRWIVVVGLAFVACWSGRAATTTSAPEGRELAGSYWCSIGQRGVAFPRYRCLIKKVDGRLMLAKLGGAERVRGDVARDGDGFTFDGELYCAWGDCTEPLHGRFAPERDGWQGTLVGSTDGPIVIHLAPAPAFGGQGYGGDGYGDPFERVTPRR